MNCLKLLVSMALSTHLFLSPPLGGLLGGGPEFLSAFSDWTANMGGADIMGHRRYPSLGWGDPSPRGTRGIAGPTYLGYLVLISIFYLNSNIPESQQLLWLNVN